jgi:hypothetical protein
MQIRRLLGDFFKLLVVKDWNPQMPNVSKLIILELCRGTSRESGAEVIGVPQVILPNRGNHPPSGRSLHNLDNQIAQRSLGVFGPGCIQRVDDNESRSRPRPVFDHFAELMLQADLIAEQPCARSLNSVSGQQNDVSPLVPEDLCKVKQYA